MRTVDGSRGRGAFTKCGVQAEPASQHPGWATGAESEQAVSVRGADASSGTISQHGQGSWGIYFAPGHRCG